MNVLKSLVLVVCLIALVPARHAAAQGLGLRSGSTLMLSGDSTLHPFYSTATQMQVSGTTSEPVLESVLTRNTLKTFDVVIPVKGLKSKESGLDKNMYKALKADACPAITFHMASYDSQPDAAGTKVRQANVHGVLSIACQEKPVTLTAELTPGPESLRAKGSYTLLMTDYGVKPPSLMLGAIKVKDSVVIDFNLELGY